VSTWAKLANEGEEPRKPALVRPAVLLLLILVTSGCSEVPSNYFSAPKELEIDGTSHIACTGVIWIYSPSRNVADSTTKSYEITFTDDYGRPQDLRDVRSYTIRNAESATYAMPDPAPGPGITHYSDGTPFTSGQIVFFGKDGDGEEQSLLAPGTGNQYRAANEGI
jgi:hypothetical protein